MNRIVLLLLLIVVSQGDLNAEAGYALAFDGRDDYISIPHDASLNPPHFTLETWFKPSIDLRRNMGIVPVWFSKQRTNRNPVLGYNLYWDSRGGLGHISHVTGNGEGLNLLLYRTDLDADRWYHVAATHDGERQHIYLDGELVATGHTEGDMVGTNGELRLGHATDPNRCHFNGLMDEVRIWSYARSAEEINSTMRRSLNGDENGLVSYWNFNENEGNRVFDQTDNQNNGAFRGNPQWVESDAPLEDEDPPDDRHFDFERTEENHALLIRNATFNDDELEENDEIGVFTPGGLCAGAGIWEADGIGLVAWMDDEDTDEIDGFREGEHFFFRVWRHEEDEEYPAESEWQHGPSVFRPDAFSVLSIHVSSVLECTIEMQQGWNLISANVEPSVRNIIEIFSPLTERDNCPLVVVKDQFGHFYLPDWGFNNIPDWVFSEGYLILLTEAAELTIEGDYIEPDRSIELHAGWQLVAYYPAWELDVEDAVASITDNLFLVKDQAGAFYIPRYRFCNMEPLQTGQGYWLWMIRDDDLVYPAERPGRDDNRLGEDRVQHIYKPIFTDNNMSLLLTGNGLLPGDEVIALNSSEEVIGSGIAENNGYCGITLWGRSNFSPEDKGLDDGEVPQFRVIRGIYSLEASLKVIEGSSSYKANTFTLAEIIFADNPMANSFNLFEPYPNPFNNETLISFNLRVNGMVHLELIDISGKLVKTLVDDQYNAGYHRVSLNAEGLSNGIYILRLIANDGNAVRKISLIR